MKLSSNMIEIGEYLEKNLSDEIRRALVTEDALGLFGLAAKVIAETIVLSMSGTLEDDDGTELISLSFTALFVAGYLSNRIDSLGSLYDIWKE